MCGEPERRRVLGRCREPVVGGQHEQVLVAADALVEVRDERGQLAIETREIVFRFEAFRTERMTDVIGRGEADREQVRRRSAAQTSVATSLRTNCSVSAS